MLIEENIEVIIFPDIPHDLPNYMLYCIAKELNIKTIILVPSFFLDKFHYIFQNKKFHFHFHFQNCKNPFALFLLS